MKCPIDGDSYNSKSENRTTSEEDFNFDSHPDKKVFASRGSGRGATNESFEISLYNPKTKTYVLHEGLSELCNPYPNAVKKEIHTAARSGTMGSEHGVYVWKANELVMTERITSKDSYDDKGFHLIVTSEKLVDGKLTLVSTERQEVEGELIFCLNFSLLDL